MNIINKQYKKLWNIWFNLLGWSYNPFTIKKLYLCNNPDEEKSIESFSPTGNQNFTFDINDIDEDDKIIHNTIFYNLGKICYTLFIWGVLSFKPFIHVIHNRHDSLDQMVSRISF